MSIVVGIALAAGGCCLLAYSPRLARHAMTLQFSYEEIRGTSGRWRHWVRPVRIVATGMYMVIGGILIYSGVTLL